MFFFIIIIMNIYVVFRCSYSSFATCAHCYWISRSFSILLFHFWILGRIENYRAQSTHHRDYGLHRSVVGLMWKICFAILLNGLFVQICFGEKLINSYLEVKKRRKKKQFVVTLLIVCILFSSANFCLLLFILFVSFFLSHLKPLEWNHIQTMVSKHGLELLLSLLINRHIVTRKVFFSSKMEVNKMKKKSWGNDLKK